VNAEQLFEKYNGKKVGTNAGDTGQCVGWYNVGLRDQTGVLYPIQGANFAYQILSAKNTRPDLVQQVHGTAGIQPGDWPIFAQSMPGSGGGGHVDEYLGPNGNGFISADQNWGGQYVHRVAHNSWNWVIGYIHLVKNTVSSAGTAKVLRPCNVRVAPNTSAALGGSQHLNTGDTFQYQGKVVGQDVNQNGVHTNSWYHSTKGNYVWSGNCTG
jgi:hypothetical protein